LRRSPAAATHAMRRMSTITRTRTRTQGMSIFVLCAHHLRSMPRALCSLFPFRKYVGQCLRDQE
jgi:hypothetical protein